MVNFSKKHTITVGYTDTVSYGYSSKTIRTEDTIEVELTEDSKLSDAYTLLKKSIYTIHQNEVQKAFCELKQEVNDRKAQEEKEREEEALRKEREKEANRLPETKEEAERVIMKLADKEIAVKDFLNSSTIPQVEEKVEEMKDKDPRAYRALLIMLNRCSPVKVATKAPSASVSEGHDEYQKAYNYPTPSFCQMKGKNKDVRILGNCTTRELTWISTANKSTDLERRYAKILLNKK